MLWVHCTFPILFQQRMKFQVNSFYSLEVIARTNTSNWKLTKDNNLVNKGSIIMVNTHRPSP